jgi:hypothetical protein
VIISIIVVLVLFAHAIVGQRGLDNAIRLSAAIYKRIGVEPLPRPPHPLRHLASLATSLVSAPFVGLFLVWMPKRRRPWVALVAIGMAKAAWKRGAICEHALVRFDEVITSWTFRFGEELPDVGREPPDIDDLEGL